MKSIMEEASSVAKAIEKGWIQAGKPQEFTIKVFEEATKNFLGITTKPAKIAIFFEEKSAYAQSRHTTHDMGKQRPVRQKQSSSYANPGSQTRLTSTDTAADRQKPAQKKQPSRPQQPKNISATPTEKPVRESSIGQTSGGHAAEREIWTPEMVTAAQGWMEGLLSSLDKQHLNFSTEVKNYYLRINVTTPVIDDVNQEKALFRNCAYLIMQSLRNKFKKSFRGFKIILSSAR